ncbi:hypothetical protein JCM3774_006649 [Rhodotorula dairenensis]
MAELFDGAYRPRPTTAAEEAAERERQVRSKAGLIRRVHSKPAKRYTLSAVAGIAYKDYALGRSAPTRSRVALDAIAYAARRDCSAVLSGSDAATGPGGRLASTGTGGSGVPRLTDLCCRVLADAYGQPGVFDAIDPDRHRAWIPTLLELVDERSAAMSTRAGAFPFQVWLDVASRVGGEMPARWKTYRDLVVSDAAELEVLKEINADAAYQHHRFVLPGPSGPVTPPPPPAFFLAYLELSSVPTFTDGDVYKLRDPLSHLLAVLRLDGTGITDDGLLWIARAARERPQYQQLEVLGLKGLRKVTDTGVVPLATLSNLRLLDVRESGCTSALRKRINSAILDLANSTSVTRTTYFRPPRETRADLDRERSSEAALSPRVEVELFNPQNYSPARMISLLHRLGDTATAAVPPAFSNDKPLGVHITALTRPASSGTAARTPAFDADTGPERRRTAEELYRSQLAIRSAPTRATHHTAYGGITSTVPISREAIEESGRKEPGERGAAFRVRDDAVMGGGNAWSDGRDHKPGTADYARSLGRFGGGGAKWLPHARDPYSDDETEAHAERAYRNAEAAAIAAQAREEQDGSSFYQYRRAGGVDRRIKPRGERTFVIPPKEDGMLLRLLPYLPPWEEAERPIPLPVESGPSLGNNGGGKVPGDDRRKEKKKKGDVLPAPTLIKKRRRDETGGDPSQTPFDASSGSTLFFGSRASAPSRTLVNPGPTSSSSSPSSSAAYPFTPDMSPSLANPTGTTSGKKGTPTLYTPRSDPKNLVKTGTALPKRSTLAAFRARR